MAALTVRGMQSCSSHCADFTKEHFLCCTENCLLFQPRQHRPLEQTAGSTPHPMDFLHNLCLIPATPCAQNADIRALENTRGQPGSLLPCSQQPQHCQPSVQEAGTHQRCKSAFCHKPLTLPLSGQCFSIPEPELGPALLSLPSHSPRAELPHSHAASSSAPPGAGSCARGAPPCHPQHTWQQMAAGRGPGQPGHLPASQGLTPSDLCWCPRLAGVFLEKLGMVSKWNRSFKGQTSQPQAVLCLFPSTQASKDHQENRDYTKPQSDWIPKSWQSKAEAGPSQGKER